MPKEYDPEQLIGGPALPVNRAKDMARVFPSDEARKSVVEHAAQLHSAEIHGKESKTPGMSFSKSEFKKKFGFSPESLLESDEPVKKKPKK